jgi:hypothetical protein
LHVPLQHSVPLPHAAAEALQHVFPAPHVSPAQQSPSTLHAAPPIEHPHFVVALLQIAPLQQSAVTPHVAPADVGGLAPVAIREVRYYAARS